MSAVATKESAFTLAMQHFNKGALKQAIPYFNQALAQEPDDVNVMYRAMLCLIALRDYSGAARFLQLLQPYIDPANTPAWMLGGFYYNLGISYEASGQWAAGERNHRNALAFEPNAVQPMICIGANCYRQGRPEEGRRWHDRVLELETVDFDSRTSRSLVRLLRFDYLKGFQEYETRWKMPQVIAHSYIPKGCWRWKGKPLGGQKILVVGEQGIGDALMMARYLPLIEERGGKLVLVLNPTLRRLFQHNFPNAKVYATGEQHPECKWWAPMMSLPYIFGTTMETVPSYRMEIKTAHREADRLEVGLQTPKGSQSHEGWKIVGYATSGNPLQMNDKDRSAPPGAFASLLETPGIDFVDLSEAADRARGAADMLDTASLVSQLDLVITVDTAIGHLAGVLGIPCWLLTQTAMEWRWGLPEDVGDMSPWYPKHKLYRRRTVDAWPEVMERVKADLLAMVEK